MAYYYAVPHGFKQSRLTLATSLKKPTHFPQVKQGFYLIKYLEDIGLCTNNGERIVPLSLSEINAWVESTGLNITHNERMHVKKLSGSFVSAFNESSKEGAQPYYFTNYNT